MMRRNSILTTLFAVLLSMTMTASTFANDMLSAWEALPETTIMAVRVPHGNKFLDAMRAQTKFGREALSEDKISKFWDILKESDPEGWAEMVNELEKYDMKTEDFNKMFDGDLGMAMVLESSEDETPVPIMLMWTNPGTEIATKMYTALGRAVAEEEVENEIEKSTRVDFKIASVDVMQVTSPEVAIMEDEFFAEPPGGFANMTPEEIEEFFEKQQAELEDAEPQVVDYTQAFLARIDDRMIMAIIPPHAEEKIRSIKAAGDEVDIDEVTHVELAKGVLARFFESQMNGEGGGFSDIINKTPGLDGVLPEGVTGLEFAVNIKSVIEMARNEGEMGEQEWEMVENSGILDMGNIVGRMALDGTKMSTGVRMVAPAPRRGFMSFLDMDPGKTTPAPWVGKNVASYSHVNYNFGKFYEKLKEIVTEMIPPEAGMSFADIELQTKASANVDLPELFKSMGDRMVALTFPMKPVPEDEAADEFLDPAAQLGRQAMVFKLTDETQFNNLMTFINTMIGFGGPGAQIVEEQGFRGVRMDQEAAGIEAGIFLGKGYFVIGMGEGVSEQVLSMLSNPPEGEDALANSDLYQRAKKLLPERPVMMYGLSDMSKPENNTMASGLNQILDAARSEAMMVGEGDVDMLAMIEAFEELLPDEKTMAEMFGVNVNQVFVDEHGLGMQWVLELPEE